MQLFTKLNYSAPDCQTSLNTYNRLMNYKYIADTACCSAVAMSILFSNLLAVMLYSMVSATYYLTLRPQGNVIKHEVNHSSLFKRPVSHSRQTSSEDVCLQKF